MTGETHNEHSPSMRDQVYAFLVRYKRAHDGNSPTLREIASACHISVSSVSHHLTRLRLDGRIVFRGKSRMIELAGATWQPPDAYAGEADEFSQDVAAREQQDDPDEDEDPSPRS
jgi:hypothetical protein